MLTLRCRLLRGTFEGESADAPGLPEWPPGWMRLFSAFVSVADPGGRDDDLLRTLEGSEPPELRASPPDEALNRDLHRTAFVPTNRTEAPAHSVLPARKNASRRWARVAPRKPAIFYIWPDLELSDGQRRGLVELCRRVPYLGRTTSPAIVEVVDQEAVEDLGWSLRPRSREGPGARFVAETEMRVPFAGALDKLRSSHEAKYLRGAPGDPWQIGEWVEYGHERTSGEEVRPVRGPLGPVAVLTIEGRTLDGRHAARITTELRRAIRSRADRDIAAIHGHHSGEASQCSFLALPFVGAEHADGHLLGVAVALPRNLNHEDAEIIVRALPAVGETMELTCGALGVLTLRRLAPLDAAERAWALQPERWRGPATQWVTAYPIVFDRFLKRKNDPEQELRRTVERSGYPTPEEVVLSRYPLLPGGLDLAPSDTVRLRRDGGFKPYTHALLSFDRVLEGPVVIGSMRHYGLGLCAPFDSGLGGAGSAQTNA